MIDPLIDALAKTLITRPTDEAATATDVKRPRLATLLRWFLVAVARAARGIIVSGAAIRGMQLVGLQRR